MLKFFMKFFIQIFFFIVISRSLFASSRLELDGHISKTYNGCQVSLKIAGQTNSPSTTTVRNGRFQLAIKLLNEYESVLLERVTELKK